MPRHRNHYIRGQKITSPSWNGLDTVPSTVVMARVFREGLDQGSIAIDELDLWIKLLPENQQSAFQTALKALGINH